MAKFIASGFRAVEADSAADAAKIFATRAAKKAYGANAYCRSLRLDSWREDRTGHTFEAFIGRNVRGERGACAGHNEWLSVYRINA